MSESIPEHNVTPWNQQVGILVTLSGTDALRHGHHILSRILVTHSGPDASRHRQHILSLCTKYVNTWASHSDPLGLMHFYQTAR